MVVVTLGDNKKIAASVCFTVTTLLARFMLLMVSMQLVKVVITTM